MVSCPYHCIPVGVYGVLCARLMCVYIQEVADVWCCVSSSMTFQVTFWETLSLSLNLDLTNSSGQDGSKSQRSSASAEFQRALLKSLGSSGNHFTHGSNSCLLLFESIPSGFLPIFFLFFILLLPTFSCLQYFSFLPYFWLEYQNILRTLYRSLILTCCYSLKKFLSEIILNK